MQGIPPRTTLTSRAAWHGDHGTGAILTASQPRSASGGDDSLRETLARVRLLRLPVTAASGTFATMSTITAILEASADGSLHLPLPEALKGGRVRVVAQLEAVPAEAAAVRRRSPMAHAWKGSHPIHDNDSTESCKATGIHARPFVQPLAGRSDLSATGSVKAPAGRASARRLSATATRSPVSSA